MTEDLRHPVVPRRSFVSRLAAGLAALGVAVPAATAAAQSSQGARWQPARHREDDWLDAIPGSHRFFLDSVSPQGVGDAILYTTNFFTANKSGYQVDSRDLAVVLCLRHFATPFAYRDAIWAKYGAALAGALEFVDPKTKQAPSLNVYTAAGYDALLRSRGNTLDALADRGVHFAVCDMATRRFSSVIAASVGSTADVIYKELVANAIPNAHFVPAGIVALSRAQERGYSFSYVG